jgi:hypothetical protein
MDFTTYDEAVERGVWAFHVPGKKVTKAEVRQAFPLTK